MLISESMQKIIRVLLNKKELSLRKLSKESNVSLGLTVKITNQLKLTGYISKRAKISVRNYYKLLNAWAYSVSIKEIPTIEFNAAERPQYLIKKIANLANKNKLKYAFTLFSATEICCPYVSPNETHLYIREKEKWTILEKNNIFPAQKGNIKLMVVDDSFFYNIQTINSVNIISYPQLYVDLFSYGGRGEEAAQELLKVIKGV